MCASRVCRSGSHRRKRLVGQRSLEWSAMQIGFIGFGEAGFTIGLGLRQAGLAELFAYDIATTTADKGPLIRRRAATAGATLVASPAELAANASILISTVTCSSALDAARQHAPFLCGPGESEG